MNYKSEYKFAKAREKEEKKDLREKKKEQRQARWQECKQMLWVKAEHLAPPGANLERLRMVLVIGLIVCSLAMFVQFISTWTVACQNLFEWNGIERHRRIGVELPTFLYLIRGTYQWFLAVVVAALFVLIDNYTCYYRGSRSIYVMKRLPNRFEIHKRAWTLPVLACVLSGIVIILTALLCLLVYRFCSPADCLPELWLTGFEFRL